MRVRPIPISLLPHSCECYPVTLKDWEEEIKDDGVPLKNVRIEYTSKRILSKDNKEKALTALLFFDAVNSSPKNHQFKRGDLIHFNGTDYHIEVIEALYEFNRLHHYEIGLI